MRHRSRFYVIFLYSPFYFALNLFHDSVLRYSKHSLIISFFLRFSLISCVVIKAGLDNNKGSYKFVTLLVFPFL